MVTNERNEGCPIAGGHWLGVSDMEVTDRGVTHSYDISCIQNLTQGVENSRGMPSNPLEVALNICNLQTILSFWGRIYSVDWTLDWTLGLDCGTG